MVACAEGSRDFLAVLRMVTPKRSGALMDSETVTGPTGSGAFAVAEVGPHIIYAEFRNEGGTISAKVEPARSGGKYPSGKPRRHSLHWPGGFAMHVTRRAATTWSALRLRGGVRSSGRARPQPTGSSRCSRPFSPLPLFDLPRR